MKLRRQGGFIGVDDQVIVYTDGCTRLTHRSAPAVKRCLTGTDLRKLRADLKRLVPGRSQTQPPGADLYKYTLTYHGKSVVRYTLPATWRPVVKRLEKLLNG
ncbi:hypothetical protein Skr01_12930 [Sphaerisporangium krabiense]|nr:hypothetical protein Skr01_12930 [Sphaerisporangium krabiense]